jgi:hypothetical protein
VQTAGVVVRAGRAAPRSPCPIGTRETPADTSVFRGGTYLRWRAFTTTSSSSSSAKLPQPPLDEINRAVVAVLVPEQLGCARRLDLRPLREQRPQKPARTNPASTSAHRYGGGPRSAPAWQPSVDSSPTGARSPDRRPVRHKRPHPRPIPTRSAAPHPSLDVVNRREPRNRSGRDQRRCEWCTFASRFRCRLGARRQTSQMSVQSLDQ